ncbi:MAG: purple acid phosphatase family protein [Blastocatellales bacterium]
MQTRVKGNQQREAARIAERPLALRIVAVSLTALFVISSLTPACRQSPTVATVTRGPYLQMSAPSSVVIRWRTNLAVNSRVGFGLSSSSLNQAVADATPATEHSVTLAGLQPNTTYYYSVGSSTGDLAGDYFITPPAPGASKPARIWVLGDAGTADANQRAVRDAYYNFNGSRHTDLWLMLGDNAYSYGTDLEYQDAIFNVYPVTLRRSSLWPALGNHDTAGSSNPSPAIPYYRNFTLPQNAEAGGVASGTEDYYSFDYSNIHFVCLDSVTSSRAPGSPMLTWLEADLAANKQDWLIAYWHHPPYSKGSHDSDTGWTMIEMRSNVAPILEAHGVDLVLTGHSHSYERSYLIDGHYGPSSTFNDSMKKDGGDGRPAGSGVYRKPTLGPAAREGAVYVVAGSSGKLGGGRLNHPAMFTSLNNLGSVVLDVDGNRLDAKFIRADGTVGDNFTIIKGPDRERRD